jgi:hypothetical protein
VHSLSQVLEEKNVHIRAAIRPVLALLAFCYCASLFIWMASGQQPPPTSSNGDLNALLKRMEANNRANKRIAAGYKFDWTSRCKIYNRKGKRISDSFTQWVTEPRDGVEYSRIVEVNGHPLAQAIQNFEQMRSVSMGGLGKGYDFIFQIVTDDPHNYIYSDLPVSYLDTLFENRVVGHQLINGRDSLIVESTPKADAKPQSEREKTALDWKETTWIDIEDEMPARYDLELINSKKYLLKGSAFSLEFTRLPVMHTGSLQLPLDAWLMHSDSGHFLFWPTNSEVLRDDYFHYKRIKSDAHMIVDPVREVPTPAEGNPPK